MTFFVSPEKLFSFLRYLKFCPYFFVHVYKKVKVSFKIYDVIYWKTNNYNAHIAQYLENMKFKSGNEI